MKCSVRKVAFGFVAHHGLVQAFLLLAWVQNTFMPGTLYVVATPIGNLEDLTHRATRILNEVSLIACEDTRHTRKLLNHYGIKTRTVSYHEHNEREQAVKLIELLKTGADIAIVSDAGTPAISDPGFRVVSLALAENIPVVPLPDRRP